MFDGKEPVGSGCVAQVYRAKAKVKSVDDPGFQRLVEEMEKRSPGGLGDPWSGRSFE